MTPRSDNAFIKVGKSQVEMSLHTAFAKYFHLFFTITILVHIYLEVGCILPIFFDSHTQKTSNQNVISNKPSILIGQI